MGKILAILILFIGIRIAYKVSEIGRKPFAPKGSDQTFIILLFVVLALTGFISSIFD